MASVALLATTSTSAVDLGQRRHFLMHEAIKKAYVVALAVA